ncbi:MAG: hypothetical protein COV44_00570 [Deltaproteobacteria bacterium CG11_big_fil_rev_8_21_14_0_20_45_16]|nr:MAG: hypothetical protein COV44_00570 [Deltaproteobacteria bacterium CG11_big_fil_rev_8_21_14_0_20_45_16]
MNAKLLEQCFGQKLGDFSIHRIWTDSRSIQVGDVFVAIKGDNFDGHNFLEQAQESGAVALIGSEAPSKSIRIPYIQVSDSVEAIRKLAAAYRAILNIKIIAVAGSNGKTTTKEMIFHHLCEIHTKEKVFKSKKSENSILGIGLSLLQIRNEEIAVLEVGIDEPGWMIKHLQILQPDIGIITSIQEEHLERLKDIETVAREELRLASDLKERQKIFVANYDSEWIRLEALGNRTLSYSLKHRADIEGRFLPPNTLEAFGLQWKNPLPGSANAENLLGSLAVITALQPELKLADYRKLCKQFENFQGEPHRSLWYESTEDCFVYDDCYNANPSSMEAAIQTFLEIAEGFSRIAILGDMFDLGPSSFQAHQRILNLAMVSGFDKIFVFGVNFRECLSQMPSPPSHIQSFIDKTELRQALHSMHKDFAAYLIKGSRGNRLEEILDLFPRRKNK